MTETTPSPQSDLTIAMVKETSRIEEDSWYSAKSHFNAASLWSKLHYWLGVPATICTAAAGAAFIKDWAIAAQLLSALATILTGLVTFLKPNEKSTQHKAVADQYLTLKNDARVFREIELLEAEDNRSATGPVKALSKRRNELNSTAPVIPRWAFNATRKGIAAGEATYAVDQKI